MSFFTNANNLLKTRLGKLAAFVALGGFFIPRFLDWFVGKGFDAIWIEVGPFLQPVVMLIRHPYVPLICLVISIFLWLRCSHLVAKEYAAASKREQSFFQNNHDVYIAEVQANNKMISDGVISLRLRSYCDSVERHVLALDRLRETANIRAKNLKPDSTDYAQEFDQIIQSMEQKPHFFSGQPFILHDNLEGSVLSSNPLLAEVGKDFPFSKSADQKEFAANWLSIELERDNAKALSVKLEREIKTREALLVGETGKVEVDLSAGFDLRSLDRDPIRSALRKGESVFIGGDHPSSIVTLKRS